MVWGDKHCLACLAPPWQPWKVAGSLGPWRALTSPDESPKHLDRQSLLWGDETWGTFTVVVESPSSPVRAAGRLDLTVSGWIPLTYSLPDPGWPRDVDENDAGTATELGGIPILPCQH